MAVTSDMCSGQAQVAVHGQRTGVSTAPHAEDDPSFGLPTAVCDMAGGSSTSSGKITVSTGVIFYIGIWDVHVKGWFKPRRRVLPYSGIFTSFRLSQAFSIILHFHVGISFMVGRKELPVVQGMYYESIS